MSRLRVYSLASIRIIRCSLGEGELVILIRASDAFVDGKGVMIKKIMAAITLWCSSVVLFFLSGRER